MSYKDEINNVAQWMKEYCDEAGAKGFVIGISGGIDSSVIACLAVKAVGKENVIGVSLPCQTREDMIKDARKLIRNISIRSTTIKLGQPVGFLADELKTSQIKVDNLVLANIKARIRMTALYAIAGTNNYLVAGTGNLSELMIGYFTKFGDGGVDIEPLGNYYKTQVYKMAELMTEIPNAIRVKAPSADLWEGQTDEEEIGMSYKKLDLILPKMANCMTWHQCFFDTDGITEEEYNKVVAMILKADHKNNLPPKYID